MFLKVSDRAVSVPWADYRPSLCRRASFLKGTALEASSSVVLGFFLHL